VIDKEMKQQVTAKGPMSSSQASIYRQCLRVLLGNTIPTRIGGRGVAEARKLIGGCQVFESDTCLAIGICN